MKADRYDELLNTLRRWRDRFATDLREQIEDSPVQRREAQRLYRNAGVGEKFGSWLEHFTRQLAIQFSLKTLFIRVLEDQNLLPHRIRTRDSQQLFQELSRYLGAADYLRFIFRDAAYLLPDLFEETEQDIVWPAGELVQEFLEEVWRRPDVDRQAGDQPWLRYDFRNGLNEGFDTRFIGDLYQDIDAEARQRYALLQTPHFISQFILEHTLLKRFEEQDFRAVTLIDPTCGSGHFLVDAFYMFADRYLSEGEYQDIPEDRARLARHIVEHHLFGADINPYACALARFRLMLAMVDFSKIRSLAPFRDQHFNIVNCDSLIPYEDLAVVGFQAGLSQTKADMDSEMQQRFGSAETIAAANRLFSRDYDVVVGNPPYIVPNDPIKKDLYREHYASAYWSFGLSAPFTERFVNLSVSGGQVGLINSNAFTRRRFGKKLIEEVLPKYEAEAIIDLSGAYIPGHGTPTLILFLRNQLRTSQQIKVVACLKGESTLPEEPAKGDVWSSIAEYFASDYFENEFVEIASVERKIFDKHPWSFDLIGKRLQTTLTSRGVQLANIAKEIGSDCAPGLDDVFIAPSGFFRRLRIPTKYLRPLLVGEEIRNWLLFPRETIIYPYNDNLEPIELHHVIALRDYLKPFRILLANRISWKKTMEERGLYWYEYDRFFKSKHKGRRIVYTLIATHNHFVVEPGNAVLKNSGMVVKLPKEKEEQYPRLAGLLNSAATCFFLKQLCFNKGAGEDPPRDRYVYDAGYVKLIPVPSSLLTRDSTTSVRLDLLVSRISDLAEQHQAVSFRTLFGKEGEPQYEWNRALRDLPPPNPDYPEPFSSTSDLEFARDYANELQRNFRQRMIFLQEEIDWLIYETYRLIPRAPLADDYLALNELREAKLELGQRAFEQAGRGYKGDWPPSWKKGAKDHLPGPAAELSELSENMQRLIRDRMDIIRTNKDIALLEDPLYKRRWIPPDTKKEFTEALEWWMREMAEWELEQAGRPLHINEWSRRLMQHERVRAALEVYTGTPAYDPVTTIERVIKSEAVSNRPEHYLSESGMRKLARGEQEFTRADFSDADAWRIRGKLNIPRERYIAYTSFEPGWHGWAGWNEEERAEALVYLLQQATRKGWEVLHQQCGLRASLRDLLPALDHLPRPEQQEFEGIAFMCGIRENCFCEQFRDAPTEKRPPGFGGEPAVKQSLHKEEGGQLSLF